METEPQIDYAAALVEQTKLFGELIRNGDPSTPVPTCPDWNLQQLFRHVGRGNRWAGQMVADRMTTVLDPRSARDGKPPADPDAAIEWLNDGVRQLVDDAAAADAPIWTFTGPRPATWWVRRRLHEATVHRADAAIARGVTYELAPDLAADCISEWLDLLTARTDDPPLAAGSTIHLYADDDGAERNWMIRSDGDGLTWESVDGTATTTVRGAAVNIMLALLRRLPSNEAGLEIVGDQQVWADWLDGTGF